jgi:1-acyl-sn-glycerol-3-phosphate acyltransferase
MPRQRSVGPEQDAPISLLGKCRVFWRAIGILLALLVCVPLHYVAHGPYGSPLPRIPLSHRPALWRAGARAWHAPAP